MDELKENPEAVIAPQGATAGTFPWKSLHVSCLLKSK
jgi:hypothetical protein